MTIIVNLKNGDEFEFTVPHTDLLKALADAKIAYPNWSSMLITIVNPA